MIYIHGENDVIIMDPGYIEMVPYPQWAHFHLKRRSTRKNLLSESLL